MQQYPGNRVSIHSLRPQRTQPALPGVTSPTAPVIVPSTRVMPQPKPRKKQRGRHAVLQLLGLGVLLETLYLALYPLLAGAIHPNDPVQQALPGIFPWLPHLYWTTGFPTFTQFLAHIPWLNPLSVSTASANAGAGSASLSLLLLGFAFVLSLIASRVGARVARERLSPVEVRAVFVTTMLLTGVFGVTLLCVSVGMNALSQDMLLYGLYGRMVVVYHANPYVVAPTSYPHDLLQMLVGAQGTAPYGPVWTDLSLLVTLLAHESVANVLIGFRLIGLLAHLANAILIWVILAKVKPEARISATLLYAWNPVVLLLGIGEMHQQVVVILCVLLAILFFQRRSLTLGWVFVLLAALITLSCLLLVPLFFRVMGRESRILLLSRRLLWWLGVGAISTLVIVLAYAPYWHGWGIAGLGKSVRQTFLPDGPINSLNATLLNLLVKSSPTWLTNPSLWSLSALIIVGCFLLLGMWLVDTPELALLFGGWLLLILVVLLPVYWPWYVILPFALAVCSASRHTTSLAVLLTLGALLSCYSWLWPSGWVGQALFTIGLPLLLWGWTLFFTSMWHMTHVDKEEQPQKRTKASFSRPPWLSRPGRQ